VALPHPDRLQRSRTTRQETSLFLRFLLEPQFPVPIRAWARNPSAFPLKAEIGILRDRPTAAGKVRGLPLIRVSWSLMQLMAMGGKESPVPGIPRWDSDDGHTQNPAPGESSCVRTLCTRCPARIEGRDVPLDGRPRSFPSLLVSNRAFGGHPRWLEFLINAFVRISCCCREQRLEEIHRSRDQV